jgi:hypothetical protein
MSESKKFTVDRISYDMVIAWVKKATEVKATKIFVSLTCGNFTPYYLLPDENEEQKIEEVKNAGDYFVGYLDVEELVMEFCL